ncbi:MAG TPA: pseudouridine synthase, partial [Candidatus Saccharibacteria bacterium]|nr:pseudouridine synthase [Candidatus Saccharibacteria bacterium]
SIRLNKFLAHAAGISRRQADEAIAAGRVRVEGTTAVMGTQVADGASVTLDGKLVSAQQNYTYIVLHKPVSYICSRRRQGNTPTIYELLPVQYRALKAVGRLDKDSSGLLLLTDDGDFAHRMTHPGFHKTKVYEVQLNKPLEPLHQQMISDYGITLEDGVSQFLVEKLEHRPQDRKIERPREVTYKRTTRTSEAARKTYRVTMHEGRNRQIRRTFAALGYTVARLHRITFGNYSLGDIKSGTYEVTVMR